MVEASGRVFVFDISADSAYNKNIKVNFKVIIAQSTESDNDLVISLVSEYEREQEMDSNPFCNQTK
jgi:hypothetical protein